MQKFWAMRGIGSCWLALAVIVFLAFAAVGQAATETIRYVYFNDGQLRKANYGATVVRYGYDASGNRIKQTVASPGPVINVAPESLSFGTLNAGTTSTPQTVTITNIGEAPLNIQLIHSTGIDHRVFNIQNNTCSYQTLQVGSTCALDVMFHASGPEGPKSAALAVNSNAEDTPTLNIPLSGASACQFAISPMTASYPYTAATGSVNVTTQTGCIWNAESYGWLSFTNGTNRTGSGTVDYSLALNHSDLGRTATVLIAEQSFTVTQGREPCAYSVSPTTIRFGAAASTLPMLINANFSSCSWNITGWPNWVTVDTTSGNGTTTVNLTALANTASTYRSAIMTAADQQVTVRQGITADMEKIGVFRSGNFYLDATGNGVWEGCGAPADPTQDLCILSWGMAGDIPAVGDWNGDGKSKIGVFRNGEFYLDYAGNGTWEGCGAPADPTREACISYGMAGDIAVVGDWNGDGKPKIGVFRSGNWYLDYKGTGVWAGCGAPADPTQDLCILSWGMAGDIPVVGDWNGDGKSKIGVFRNGEFYLDYAGNGTWEGCGAPADPTREACVSYGMTGDIPVVGDWSGSGISKIGVFRSGNFYLDFKGTGVWSGCGAPADPTKDACIGFGMGGDVPVVGKW